MAKTATRFELPLFQAFDSSGDPLDGGKLYAYAVGTSTPKDTYSDVACTTPRTNPIILDSSGLIVGGGAVYLNGSYKFVLKNSADVTQWTLDNVLGVGGPQNKIADADGDTKIQVEESTDEDKVRVDIAGTEKMLLSGTATETYIQVNALRDADGDTKIQVEEGSDEDVIRMDIAGTEQFKLSADGLVQVKQPAFSAYLSTDQNNFATGSDITVLFDTERFDQGGDFDTGTHKFTAPVTGKYQFNFFLRLNNVDTAAAIYSSKIRTTTAEYGAVFDPQKFSGDLTNGFTLNVSVLAAMAAGNTAWGTIQQNSGTAQTDIVSGLATYFSGFLAC